VIKNTVDATRWSKIRAGKPRFFKKKFLGFRFLGFKGFLKSFFRFLGFNVYEDRTQNYDSEIHEEYLIHDTPFPLLVIAVL